MFIKVHTSCIGQTGYNAHARDFFTALSHKIPLKIRNFSVGKSWKGLGSINPKTGFYDDPHANEKYLTEYQRKLLCEQTVITKGKVNWGPNNEYSDHEINDGLNYLKQYKKEDIINLVLNETNHHYYYHDYEGIKIAYNVWEQTKQPEGFFNKLKEFDQFWCPSEWQKQCTIKQGFPADKVFVVPEAVDGETFKPDWFNYELPNYKDNRFKFVHFGRWDYRKSTTEIIRTFLDTFQSNEPVDLILSIDNDYSFDGMKTTEERLNYHKFNDDRLKIINFLQREDYLNYMRNGHVFLSCARSEGWNLPLIEAMACGTPSIYSNWSAQLEFASGKGHPVKVLGEKPAPGGAGNYIEPDFKDLSRVMRDVYTNYWKYKEKALKDSEIIRTQFSWENAANKAYEILKNLKK